jgi:hypothetical protein
MVLHPGSAKRKVACHQRKYTLEGLVLRFALKRFQGVSVINDAQHRADVPREERE